MFGRICVLRKSAQTLQSSVQIRNLAKFKPYCDPHMNELPVPCGPWSVMYERKQKYYNRTLFVGIVWFLISIACLISSNALFMNWTHPPWPAPAPEKYQSDDGSDCE